MWPIGHSTCHSRSWTRNGYADQSVYPKSIILDGPRCFARDVLVECRSATFSTRMSKLLLQTSALQCAIAIQIFFWSRERPCDAQVMGRTSFGTESLSKTQFQIACKSSAIRWRPPCARSHLTPAWSSLDSLTGSFRRAPDTEGSVTAHTAREPKLSEVRSVDKFLLLSEQTTQNWTTCNVMPRSRSINQFGGLENRFPEPLKRARQYTLVWLAKLTPWPY